MRPNRLRQLLNEGKPSIGTHTMVFWPGMVEIIGHTGIIDYVEFVAEYVPYDLEGLENMGRAVELFDHLTAMIKLDQEPRTFAATRAIGSGIQNVLFADVHNAEEARECVGAVRAETPQTGGHHGSGDRRFAGYILESGSPKYVQALEDCVVAFMIEKKEAVDNLEEILSVPGIDMVVWVEEITQCVFENQVKPEILMYWQRGIMFISQHWKWVLSLGQKLAIQRKLNHFSIKVYGISL